MMSFIRNHPLAVGAGATVAIAVSAWLAFGFFGVHTLFVDDVVDEAGPVFDAAPIAAEVVPAPVATTAAPAENAGDDEPAADEPSGTVPAIASPAPVTTAPVSEPPAPTTVPPTPEIASEYAGQFRSDAHPTSGEAVVLGNGTGQRFLRFEGFETDNGPDLNVYLVDSSTGDVSNFVDLGDLKGNIGDQNYEIPPDIDLDVYDRVVIWCVRFGVGFGDADLVAT